MATDVASLQLKVDTKDVVRGQKALEGLTTSASRASKEAEGLSKDMIALRRSTDPAFDSALKLQKSLDALNKEYADGKISVTQYYKQIALLDKTMGATAAGTGAAGKALKNTGMFAQQAGFQLQDFAVQVAGGQSALVAFGQQGSQLAGIFGPSGAVIGAVIAVASAIGGVFISSMKAASEELSTLTERVDEYTDRIEELGVAQAELALVTKRDQLEALRAIAKENANVSNSSAVAAIRIETLTKNLEQFPNSSKAKEWQDELRVLKADVEDFSEEEKQLIEDIELLEERIAHLRDGTEEVARETRDYTRDNERLVESLRIEAATVGLSGRALALKVAEMQRANDEQVRLINLYYGEIEAQERLDRARKLSADQAELERKALKRANDEAIAENERANREQEKLRQQDLEWEAKKLKLIEENARAERDARKEAFDATRSHLEDSMDAIKMFFGEQSAAYKAALIATRAYALAEIAMNTQIAASKSLATLGPIAGPIAAGTMYGLGALQAAAVIAQTISDVTSSGSASGSRAVGGQVSGGNSYIVGERGPEVFTPASQGTITPNNKLGGESVNVTNVINVQGDVSRQTQQQIQAILPQLIQATKRAVTNGFGKGGAMSRSVGLRA